MEKKKKTNIPFPVEVIQASGIEPSLPSHALTLTCTPYVLNQVGLALDRCAEGMEGRGTM